MTRRHIAAVGFALLCALSAATSAHARHQKQPHETSWEPWRGFPIVSEAKRWIGSGPVFGRQTLWCARFMNYILEKTGHRGSGSDQAISFKHYSGIKVSGPRVGAIAYMHGRGPTGHVGVVSGIAASGDPIIISGNWNGHVAEVTVPRRIVIAYVMPREAQRISAAQ